MLEAQLIIKSQRNEKIIKLIIMVNILYLIIFFNTLPPVSMLELLKNFITARRLRLWHYNIEKLTKKKTKIKRRV